MDVIETGQEEVPTVFPVGEFIRDELAARGWTIEELAERMARLRHPARGRGDFELLYTELVFHMDAPTPGMTLGEDTAVRLAAAFGTSSTLWLRLDRAWQAANPFTAGS